jgi:hypothetical protein
MRIHGVTTFEILLGAGTVWALVACGTSDRSTRSNGAAAPTAGAGSVGATNDGGGSGNGGGGSNGGGGPSMASGSGPVATGGGPDPFESEGTLGEWQDVTPEGLSLDQQNPGNGDNYGVQDVLADPLRPAELYAFVCYQGVWRSRDYGVTWEHVYEGEKWGKPWGTAIQPALGRDASKAPVLYVAASNIAGILKSVDFGETWSTYETPKEVQDGHGTPYSVDIDPYDVEHILIAFHESPDVAESTDGGQHWKLIKTPDGNGGTSFYPFFINTGSAETTRNTWFAVPQEVTTGTTVRTENGGSSFTDLDQFQHHHGSAQVVDLGAGVIYLAAKNPDGIHKSTDYGKTWNLLSDVSSGVIAAGKSHLYTSVGLGWGKQTEPLDPTLFVARRDDEANWTAMPAPTMVDGAKRLAVTRDASHEIVVGGNWHAGIWRFKQP